MMLSSTFDIAEFMDKMKGRPYQEVVWLTDQEAVAAARCLKRQDYAAQWDKIDAYTGCLKDFIRFVRHGIRTRHLRELELDEFSQIRFQH